MREVIKKIIKPVVIIILLLIFNSGCTSIYNQPSNSSAAEQSSAITEPTNKEVYYTIGMHILLPYWQDHRLGLEAAAAELGVDVVFTGENGNNALRQVNIFENAVKKS